MANAALVYQHVGDGIKDVSEATESLISTMKAFGIQASDSMSIVDKFNEVGNNFKLRNACTVMCTKNDPLNCWNPLRAA